MKTALYIFLAVQLFLSCSAVKRVNPPLNDYISSLNLKDSDTVMIIQEKINSNAAIAIFKGRTVYYEGIDKYVKTEGVDAPLYDEKSWEKMKRKYKNKNTSEHWLKDDYWNLNDFKHQNIIFIKQADFPNPGRYEKFDFKERYRVFSFSDLMYYKNNKYAVFAVKSTTTDYKNIDETFILVMEKKNGRWTVIQKVGDGIYR
ncbi:hypothetical protein [Flavobacterium hungaricum]|uniref:Lipoprotein n=1 Tax=Flavobacterium hungaricum TaxID=2082725 RepID=A0ABR9TGK5_9FLAO|nr:hypothetical protein [Flavobacterium hungaricum]MBE8724470.1 hypothetical protein [Flavobacterium hungaricum]